MENGVHFSVATRVINPNWVNAVQEASGGKKRQLVESDREVKEKKNEWVNEGGLP